MSTQKENIAMISKVRINVLSEMKNPQKSQRQLVQTTFFLFFCVLFVSIGRNIQLKMVPVSFESSEQYADKSNIFFFHSHV